MESPYRDGLDHQQVARPQSRGIVDEVIAQFADPFAFLRELVQNSIDAGSPQVEVEVALEEHTGLVRVAVRDRGEGMDLEGLEGSLLVLFRSTKERDPEKLGKFGIGFLSVLAASPRLVIIETTRAGRRLVVHLSPELTYQVFEQGPSNRAGTSVELEVPMARAEMPEFARRCREALRRWCQHVQVELRLRVLEGAKVHEERIDAPPTLEGALVEVRGESSDGLAAAVVGLMPGRRSHGAFYNRGLLLHQSPHGPAPGVAFKVLDVRLGHTLARDEVRRDEAYHRAMQLVEELAGAPLLAAVSEALAKAAPAEPERWGAVFEAADAAGLPLAPAQWVFPRRPMPGAASVVAAHELPRQLWAAQTEGPLAEALTHAGRVVLSCAAAARAAAVERRAHREVRIVERELVLVQGVSAGGAGERLLASLTAALAAAQPVAPQPLRSVPTLRLAIFDGALAASPWLAGGREQALLALAVDRWVLERKVAWSDPFSRRGGGELLLNRRSLTVQAALEQAVSVPAQAAALLARGILLHYGLLDEAASLALLRWSWAPPGEEAPAP